MDYALSVELRLPSFDPAELKQAWFCSRLFNPLAVLVVLTGGSVTTSLKAGLSEEALCQQGR